MCDHKHSHTHTHSHDHDDHHHDHTHNKEIAQRFITTTINACEDKHTKKEAMKEFVSIIRKINSPVDFYNNDERFQLSCLAIGIRLSWGHKASKEYSHAYSIPFGEGDGEIFTIMTNHDLDKHDTSEFPWKSHDLFEEDYA